MLRQEDKTQTNYRRTETLPGEVSVIRSKRKKSVNKFYFNTTLDMTT